MNNKHYYVLLLACLSISIVSKTEPAAQKWSDRAVAVIKNGARRITSVECAKGTAAIAGSAASVVLVKRVFDKYAEQTQQSPISFGWPLFMLGTTIFALRDSIPYACEQYKKAFWDEQKSPAVLDAEEDIETAF